jgi:hypothetical protein
MLYKNLPARILPLLAALIFFGCDPFYDDIVIPINSGGGLQAAPPGGYGPVLPTNIRITGGYLSAGVSEPPVRVYFTDGGVADGYIAIDAAAGSGAVMLYDDQWNDGKSGGKVFHTMVILGSGERILLSRDFHLDPSTDPVELVINALGGLEFRPYIPNPADGYKGYHPIDTAGELALIGRDAGTARGAYLLMRDLDLLGSPVPGGNTLVARPHNWAPIGDDNLIYGFPFNGTFDGGGRRLANLYINRQSMNTGLFAVNEGTVKNTRGSGFVRGVDAVGGIAGLNRGRIEGCSFGGQVEGTERVGGIAGEHQYATITACYNTGTVTATNQIAGGVVGIGNGDIAACYNVGPVYTGSYGGCVVGYNIGDIQACFWIPGGGVSGAFTTNYGTFTSSHQFSLVDWPRGDSDPELLWQIHNADGSGPGNYWKSMGTPSDYPGPTDFPKLWWE